MKFHRAYKTDRNPTFGVQGLHKNCWVELIDSCVTQSSDLSWLLVDLSSCPRCGGGRRHVGWMIDQIGWGEGELWGSEDVGELVIDWKWSNIFNGWWNCRLHNLLGFQPGGQLLVNVIRSFCLFIWNFWNSPDPDICGAKQAALYLCHDAGTVAKHIIRDNLDQSFPRTFVFCRVLNQGCSPKGSNAIIVCG